MKQYPKKVTVSLTEEDFSTLETMAEDDRRTTQQMASMMIEDVIKAENISNGSVSSIKAVA